MDAYTLKEKKGTYEYHLFKGKMLEKGCNSSFLSICEKMSKDEVNNNVFVCKNETETRLECAKIGRKVCGICISHLYATY